MMVCNTGPLLGVSWLAIRRWLRQGCYTRTNYLFGMTHKLPPVISRGLIAFRCLHPTLTQVGGLYFHHAQGDRISNLVAVRLVPHPDTAQSTTSRSDKLHTRTVQVAIRVGVDVYFISECCALADEGLQLRGSSADQVKRSLFQVYLLTRGGTAAIHSCSSTLLD